MVTDDLAQAELQKQEIRKRLERLKSDLAVTQEAISRAEASLSFLEGYTAALAAIKAPDDDSADKARTKSSESTRPRVRNPSREKVVDAVLSLIAEAGKPLARQQLFDALDAKGFNIQGKDRLMVFSTMLWREKERVTRLRGFGYWPANKPYAPAGYVPGGEEPTLF